MSDLSLTERIDSLVQDVSSVSDRRVALKRAGDLLLSNIEASEREWAIDLLQDAAFVLGLDEEPAGMLRLYAAQGQSHFESEVQEEPGPYPAFWWIAFESSTHPDALAPIARGGGGIGWSFGHLQSLNQIWLCDARVDASEAERQCLLDEFEVRMRSMGLAIKHSQRVLLP